MKMKLFLKSRLRAFAKETDGNMSIEALVFVPFIVTLIAITFSLYDAFRFKSLNTKAAFTISDALSRETDAITPDYVDGLVSTFEFLTRSENQYSLRITTVQYDEDSNVYEVKWSEGRGKWQGLEGVDLNSMSSVLPNMLDNETIILVETHTQYEPPFNMDKFLTDDLFYNITFTRPRFAPQLIWSDGTS